MGKKRLERGWDREWGLLTGCLLMTFAMAGFGSLVLSQHVMNEGGIPLALLQLGSLPDTAGFP